MVRKHKKFLIIMTLKGHAQSFKMFSLNKFNHTKKQKQKKRSNSQEGFQPRFKSTNHS